MTNPLAMRRRLEVARALLAVSGSALVLAFGLGACAKKVVDVDPSTQPEGTFSPDANLVIWREAPVQVTAYQDNDPAGPQHNTACENNLFPAETDPHRPAFDMTMTILPEGSIRTMIIDHTAATAFRPLRREANGGYHALLDFPLTPARKWLESGWEAYLFNDLKPSGFTPPTYVGRGLVDGRETAASPLTNVATLSSAPYGDIVYQGKCLPCDSLFTVRWDPVPGATRYWIHIFQLGQGATPVEGIKAARPAPIADSNTSDLFIGYVNAGVTAFKLGREAASGVVRLMARTPLYGQAYNVRVTAVDSRGEILAYTHGDYAQFGIPGFDQGYGLYQLGATIVTPKKRALPGQSDPPPRCQPEDPLP